MNKPHQFKEYKCTVVFRRNATGDTGEKIYFIPATDDRSAKLEARSCFMKNHEPELSGSVWVFLAVSAEVEAQTQLMLL